MRYRKEIPRGAEGGGGGEAGREENPIRGGSARKRYHFQASGTRGRDFST